MSKEQQILKVPKPKYDILTVSFNSSQEDKSALCVTRRIGNEVTVLKMELDDQAYILYRLLTEQMTKAAIKEDKNEQIR